MRAVYGRPRCQRAFSTGLEKGSPNSVSLFHRSRSATTIVPMSGTGWSADNCPEVPKGRVWVQGVGSGYPCLCF